MSDNDWLNRLNGTPEDKAREDAKDLNFKLTQLKKQYEAEQNPEEKRQIGISWFQLYSLKLSITTPIKDRNPQERLHREAIQRDIDFMLSGYRRTDTGRSIEASIGSIPRAGDVKGYFGAVPGLPSIGTFIHEGLSGKIPMIFSSTEYPGTIKNPFGNYVVMGKIGNLTYQAIYVGNKLQVANYISTGIPTGESASGIKKILSPHNLNYTLNTGDIDIKKYFVSSQFEGAAMLYAIRVKGGAHMHASHSVNGQPLSGGCYRSPPYYAKRTYDYFEAIKNAKQSVTMVIGNLY